jgi:hypothetical protein
MVEARLIIADPMAAILRIVSIDVSVSDPSFRAELTYPPLVSGQRWKIIPGFIVSMELAVLDMCLSIATVRGIRGHDW